MPPLTTLALIAVTPFLLLALMLLAPSPKPPPLPELAADARALGAAAPLQAVTRYRARDGAELALRIYPAREGAPESAPGGAPEGAPEGAPVALLIHGSGGSSREVNPLAHALAARGVAVYAPDMRGQGESGERSGDIAYPAQHDHDIADLLALIRSEHPSAPITLIGHSSGGGYALKLAAGPQGGAFARVVLIAPYLGPRAPTTRPQSGGWARANVARIIALTWLDRLGLRALHGLPVVAFAAVPNAPVTSRWSFRMMQSFSARAAWREDLRRRAADLLILAAADDAMMISERYGAEAHAISPAIRVEMLDGADHMSILGDARIAAIIAAFAMS